MGSDGRYTRQTVKRGEKAVDSQDFLAKHYGQIP